MGYGLLPRRVSHPLHLSRKGKWYILDTDAPPIIEVAAAPVCADPWLR